MNIASVKWKKSFEARGVKAEKANEVLERLQAKHGKEFTRDHVLAEAAKARSPIHKIFDWDDTVAATRWRERQASQLIASIEVTYEERPDIPVRAFEVKRKAPRSKPEQKTVFASHQAIMADPDAREMLKQEALRSLISWRKRYRDINEFEILFRDIDATIEAAAMQG